MNRSARPLISEIIVKTLYTIRLRITFVSESLKNKSKITPFGGDYDVSIESKVR